MAIIGSDDVVISWNAAPLTAVEDCPGIHWELATGDSLPFGSDLKRKRVIGVYVPDDVTLKIPVDDTAGSDYMLLKADEAAKTARAFKVALGATVYRQLTMTVVAINPVLAGGDVAMAEVKLVNTGSTKTEV